MAGKFISFEGGEGTGKSTQVQRLAERLRAQGIDVVTTREPGGTPGAEAIRALLVEGHPERWDGRAEALLVNAARADHVVRLIRPALEAGKWVISDRYVHSTLAYQGAGRGLDEAELRKLHAFATDDLWPDLTLILEVEAGMGLTRAAARRSGEERFEGEGTAFHDAVHARFLAFDEGGCVQIDAADSIEAVAERIWNVVSHRCAF